MKTSQQQFEMMVTFMEEHGDISNPVKCARGKLRQLRLWEELCVSLNSEGSGSNKSIEKWKKVWADYKSNTKKKAGRLYKAAGGTGGSAIMSKLTDLESRTLGIARIEAATGLQVVQAGVSQGDNSTDENTAPGTFATPQPKVRSYFQKVRTCCVALIVKHGRPAELLDDRAFKDIINLIPMTKYERSKLSSEAIKEYIETTDAAEAKSCEESLQEDQEDDDYVPDDDMETENAPLKRRVKDEKDDCHCPSRDTGTHEEGCQAIARDTYWQYFEVSIDEATCKLCSNVIKWSSMSDLKVHLTMQHPSVEFNDDDEEFTTDRGRHDSEGGGSIPDRTMEEVYLEEDLFLPSKPPPSSRPLPSAAKKRKFPPSAVVTLKDNESIGIERFKSLDRFGLYVASLMKLLPVEKSLKYQEQIIQRLIKEQAAAG